MFQIRLREMRLLHSYTQDSLAKRVGVDRTSIGKYETSNVIPSVDILLKLAEVLDTSVDFLLGNTDDPTPPAKRGEKEGVLRIPVYGTIPAGVPMEAIEDIVDVEEAPIAWARGDQEFFALKIQGDSMAPKYLADDVVIFRKTPDCESGQECAVMVNGQDATFKKVFKNDRGITLQPLNLEYEPRFYTNDEIEKLPLEILGVVKEIRRTVG